MIGAQAKACFTWLCAVVLGCGPAVGAEAFITDQSGDEVSVLDLGLKHVVARIPVSGKPAGIAMAPDGRTAYVTSTEGKHVSVIDTASRKIVDKSRSRTRRLGSPPIRRAALFMSPGSISRAFIRSISRRGPSSRVSRLARPRPASP